LFLKFQILLAAPLIVFVFGCNSKGVEIVKYENGLTSVLIKNDNHIASSAIVFVRTGSVNEKPSQAGLSHFLEHLMFKGSKNYPGDLMSRNVENMCGYINAATSKQWTMYYINIQKTGIEESLKMLADAMQNPLFPQDEIDEERKVVIEEIQRHSDNPYSVLDEKYYEALYPQSALKNSVIGNEKVIANVSRGEICDYYETQYIPEKMVVVVSGNFDEDAVRKTIENTFAKFEKKNIADDPILEQKPQIANDVTDFGKVEVGYMFTGFLGPDISDDDIYTADIAASILGGGRSSRLYRTIYEEKHLVYSIGSSFMEEKGAGNLYIVSVFDPKFIDEIKSEIKKQIESVIADGISQEELARAKLTAKTDWIFSQETPFDVGDNSGYWHLMGNPKFIEQYLNKIDSLTAQDVINFFKKYYSPKNVVNTAMLPKQAE
jgi:predicted Zn-dependent peptidase